MKKVLLIGLVLASMVTLVPATPASAHPTSDYVHLYTPLEDGDSVHTDVVARWATTPGTEPARHHIVYTNWGFASDYSVDIFAPAGTRVVTPFASTTTSGHRTISRVVGIRPGCRSGSVADGGYVVTVELIDATTGIALARASLMHVNNPRVSVGQSLGGWTTIGTLAQFRYSSCYQVSTAGGVHLHFEVVNRHRYACYVPRANGAQLTELTRIGEAGIHYNNQRAAC